MESSRGQRTACIIQHLFPPLAGPGYDSPGDQPDVDEKGAVNLDPYDFRATFENPYATKP